MWDPRCSRAFLASLVEFIETLTVVLAVGAVRGWRGAIGGSGLALLVLLILVVILGPALTQIPLAAIQLAVGTLLLLFGLRWLRKAILRAIGVIPLHDEEAAFAQKREALLKFDGASLGWDRIAVTTAFKITMLEGIEGVFIVVAIGAASRGLLVPASLGALAALLVVVLLGLVLHRPVSSISRERAQMIGILLCGFGTFWVGEGMGLSWPGADWSVLALIAGYAAVALLVVAICRAPAVAGRMFGR
jgi:Ca2+/H+ antiporter, TMEM165/GDT1 family